MSYRVQLTYFKPSGKYYSTGDYDTDREWMFEIFEEVRELRDAGNLPHLVKGSKEFHILVEVPGHPHAYPALIVRN